MTGRIVTSNERLLVAWPSLTNTVKVTVPLELGVGVKVSVPLVFGLV